MRPGPALLVSALARFFAVGGSAYALGAGTHAVHDGSFQVTLQAIDTAQNHLSRVDGSLVVVAL